MVEKIRHGSLFSGIGGFDLASEWMGWENVFHCEKESFPKKVLKYYWPKSKSYDDIIKTDFHVHRGGIDILTGGFPCQPYSSAGKRLGKEDDRHLWPEMLRAIREIRPKWILGENVLGLVNWNGGLVFNEVQADLEAEGYEVQPYVLPACAVNAPHRRYRVWFVAYSPDGIRSKYGLCPRGKMSEDRIKTGRNSAYSEGKQSERVGFEQREISQQEKGKFRGNGGEIRNGNVTETQRVRPSWQEYWEKESGFNPETFERCGWGDFPTQSPIHNGDDGFSSRLDGITFSKWRDESIKGGGNAIVPNLAFQFYKAIENYENINHKR